MKKTKLLKTIGCIALVATPIIAAPIIMSTSCSSDPTPSSSISSIQGVKLVQNGQTIADKDGAAIKAKYRSSQVENESVGPNITIDPISIYFYVNNEPDAVTYESIKDEISFDFVTTASDTTSISENNPFLIRNNELITSIDLLKANFAGANSMLFALPGVGSKVTFIINGTLKLTYGLKDSTDITRTTLELYFEKI